MFISFCSYLQSLWIYCQRGRECADHQCKMFRRDVHKVRGSPKCCRCKMFQVQDVPRVANNSKGGDCWNLRCLEECSLSLEQLCWNYCQHIVTIKWKSREKQLHDENRAKNKTVQRQNLVSLQRRLKYFGDRTLSRYNEDEARYSEILRRIQFESGFYTKIQGQSCNLLWSFLNSFL